MGQEPAFLHANPAALTVARHCRAGAGEARHAWAHSSHAKAELPSPDTLVGGLVFNGGIAASVSVSFAAAQVRFSLSMVGTDGSLEVNTESLYVRRTVICSDQTAAEAARRWRSLRCVLETGLR